MSSTTCPSRMSVRRRRVGWGREPEDVLRDITYELVKIITQPGD